MLIRKKVFQNKSTNHYIKTTLLLMIWCNTNLCKPHLKTIKKTPLLAVAQWATVNHGRLIRHKRRRVPLIGSIIRTGEQDYTKHGLASDIIWCNQHVHLHQQKKQTFNLPP